MEEISIIDQPELNQYSTSSDLVYQENTSELIQTKNSSSIFNPANGSSHFELAQRMAKALAATDLVPATYKGNVANCMITLELANRIGVSPLMVMQNLYPINGRPTWSSQFVIAAINTCGRFSTLKFTFNAEKTSCYAYATEKMTGEVLRGTTISFDMAESEGWVQKKGSKWATMPELMLTYRAAAFFGRVYCPEILNGMHTDNEIEDIRN